MKIILLSRFSLYILCEIFPLQRPNASRKLMKWSYGTLSHLSKKADTIEVSVSKLRGSLSKSGIFGRGSWASAHRCCNKYLFTGCRKRISDLIFRQLKIVLIESLLKLMFVFKIYRRMGKRQRWMVLMVVKKRECVRACAPGGLGRVRSRKAFSDIKFCTLYCYGTNFYGLKFSLRFFVHLVLHI